GLKQIASRSIPNMNAGLISATQQPRTVGGDRVVLDRISMRVSIPSQGASGTVPQANVRVVAGRGNRRVVGSKSDPIDDVCRLGEGLSERSVGGMPHPDRVIRGARHDLLSCPRPVVEGDAVYSGGMAGERLERVTVSVRIPE